MARDVDTSRAICDTCGRLYQSGDAVYSIADKYDENIEDRDVMLSFRHWDCHTPVDVSVKRLNEAVKKARDTLDELRRRGL